MDPINTAHEQVQDIFKNNVIDVNNPMSPIHWLKKVGANELHCKFLEWGIETISGIDRFIPTDDNFIETYEFGESRIITDECGNQKINKDWMKHYLEYLKSRFDSGELIMYDPETKNKGNIYVGTTNNPFIAKIYGKTRLCKEDGKLCHPSKKFVAKRVSAVKLIAMGAHGERGRLAREYFIHMENAAIKMAIYITSLQVQCTQEQLRIAAETYENKLQVIEKETKNKISKMQTFLNKSKNRIQHLNENIMVLKNEKNLLKYEINNYSSEHFEQAEDEHIDKLASSISFDRDSKLTRNFFIAFLEKQYIGSEYHRHIFKAFAADDILARFNTFKITENYPDAKIIYVHRTHTMREPKVKLFEILNRKKLKVSCIRDMNQAQDYFTTKISFNILQIIAAIQNACQTIIPVNTDHADIEKENIAIAACERMSIMIKEMITSEFDRQRKLY